MTMRGDGRTFLRGKTWWFAWCFHGRERRESSHSRDRAVAKRLLRVRIGQLAKGEGPRLGDHQVLVGAVLDHYAESRQNAGRWSAGTQSDVRWLRARLGAWKVTEVTLATLTPWCVEQRKTYASGSLRTRVATLKSAMTIARKAGLIEHRADFPTLAAGAHRKGYFRPAEKAAQLAAYHERAVADLDEFLYRSGWRFNEGRGLLWTEVDRAERVIALERSRNKTRDSRTLPIAGELVPLFERRFKARRLGCPYVFHTEGRAISENRFRARFAAALETAGLGKKLPHDMRRSMSRDQIRAGVSKPVAMRNTGHRDPRVFDRYDITVVDDQAAAMVATDAYRAQLAKSDTASDRSANA